MRETMFLILNGMYTCHLMAKDRLEMPEKQGQLPVQGGVLTVSLASWD